MGEPGGDSGAGAEVTASIQRADLLDDLGRYAEAAEELRDALRLDPGNAEALATLGMVQLRAGRFRPALASAGAALAVQPGHLLGQVVRGYALVELDDRSAALAAADDLLAVDPSSWLRQLHFATIVRQVRNGQASLDAAWSAVRLAPEEPETHLVLAAVAADLGLWDVADRAKAEAARLDPRAMDTGTGAGLRLRPGREVRERPTSMLVPTASRNRSAPGLRTGVSRFLALGALYAWGGPLLVALCMLADLVTARLTAGAVGAAGVLIFGTFRSQTPDGLQPVLRLLGRLDRWLTAACVAVLAGPPMLLAFALSGSPWPLGGLILLGAFTFAALVLRADDTNRPAAPNS